MDDGAASWEGRKGRRSRRVPSLNPKYTNGTDTRRIHNFRGKPARFVKVGCTYELKPLNWSKRDEFRQRDSRTLHFRKRMKVPSAKCDSPYKLRPLSVPGFSSFQSKQPHNPRVSSYLLSSVGDDDFDEESEASRKEYATIALQKRNAFHKVSFELVEIGPLASGYSSAGRILHLNFKARNNDEPGASVQTFFTEMIKTNRNVVSLTCVRCLGPSSSLPEKAKIVGCLYCSSHNIHHPGESLLNVYHNGREYYWTTLEYQINKLYDFVWKSEEEDFIPRFSHPGLKYFGKHYQETASLLPTAALSLFNSEKKDTYFEFVKPGFSGRSYTSLGWLIHMNFEAKNKDDPDAPVQIFFAEYMCGFDFVFAVFCERLGPSDSPFPEEAKQGCTICGSCCVRHPLGPGYMNGREYLDYYD
ncbi:hypothetical protein BVRB_8g183640 [Beta vulgaris subsp. vulgaris]|nr:hypothetical protein BVRB_8g183640 [Beta vulgaris subsp. vulgaris]